MPDFIKLLASGDRRSIGNSHEVVMQIRSQEHFEEIFCLMSHPDRTLRMRALDVVEKVSRSNPGYLSGKTGALLLLMEDASDKEMIWHLAQLSPRLELDDAQFGMAWSMLERWAKNRKNGRIARVLSLQAMHDLLPRHPELATDFRLLAGELYAENIPSMCARIRILRKKSDYLSD